MLNLSIICSSTLTAFLQLRSRKTVHFSEQIMSADRYPSIFSRQMEAIFPVFKTARVAKNSNLLLTEREGRTGEYWPKVVAVRTERSEARTKSD